MAAFRFAQRFIRFCTVVAVVFAGWPARAASAPTDPATVASLRTGTLPNGVRYAVLPHPSAKGDLSLRLIVNAGSLDERDDERGCAEHERRASPRRRRRRDEEGLWH